MNQRLWQVALLAALYFAAGRLGLMFPASGSHITLLWLPTGISVAWILSRGFGCWPGISIGAIAVNLSMGMALPAALVVATGNTAAPLAAAWLLKRFNFHPLFDRQRDILLLTIAAGLGMLISSSCGVLTLQFSDSLPDGPLTAWLTWWAGDTMGVILAAPLFLAFSQGKGRIIVSHRIEFAVWLIVTVAVILFVFEFNRETNTGPLPLTFLALPLVVWGALRFEALGSSLAVILLSFAAAYATSAGIGPLAREDPVEGSVMLWLFMATCAAVGWMITALQAMSAEASDAQRIFELALNDVSVGVLFCGLDRNVIYANRGFSRLTGYSRKEVVGRNCRFLQGPDSSEETIEEIREALEENRPYDGEILNYKKDGTPFWNGLVISPVQDESGKMTGFFSIQRDISERREAEEALSESLNFNKGLIESIQDGLSVLDQNGIHIDVNPAFCDMTGYSKRELIGKPPPHPYWPEECLDEIESALKQTMAGNFGPFDLTFKRKNGERFPVIVSPAQVQCERDSGTEVLATVKDVSQDRKAQERLKKANQTLKLHFEQTPMAAIEWDLNFCVTRWNPAAESTFGYTEEEAIGKHASFIIPESYQEHVEDIWNALISQSGGERSTNENTTKDGRSIFCEWYNTRLIDKGGAVAGVASLAMDVTDRRRAQKMLAWEKQAMTAIGGTGTLTEVLDELLLEFETMEASTRTSVLLLSKNGKKLYHASAPSLPEDYSRSVDGMSVGPRSGSCGAAAYHDRQVFVADIEKDPLWDDFRDLPLGNELKSCWSIPIHGHLDKILGTFAIYHNDKREPTTNEKEVITRASQIIGVAIERKRDEEIVRESEEKYRTLFENAGDAIFLMEGEKFVDCNARTLEVFGCASRKEIVGRPPYEFSPETQPSGKKSRDLAIKRIQAALSGAPQFFEWTHTKLDGSIFPAEVSLNTVTLGGKILLQAIVRDISERKRAEEKIGELHASLERRVEQRTAELKAANKEMEAFCYSVSHDLRAPLRAVDGFSKIVSKDYSEKLDEDGKRMLDLIRSGAQRMGQLIDDLLEFSRIGRQPIEIVEIDMEKMAREVFEYQAAREPELDIKLILGALPATRGTESMIRQVWVNLISNAIKFSSKTEDAVIEIGSSKDDAGKITYFVKDNGAGFDMRHADKLFGVFQRLHSVEEFEGTGVGLALVQRIVERHNGTVSAKAELNEGATFSFSLNS